jgi:hypothetical protein
LQGLFDLVDKVDSYRAGYTPEERIALEKVGLQFHLGVFFGMVCLLLNIWVHCTENNYVDKAHLFSSCDCFKIDSLNGSSCSVYNMGNYGRLLLPERWSLALM